MRLAVISGKGGSGKSSVTAALVTLARRAIAVDCDVDASNLPLLFPHQVISREAFASGSEWVLDPSRCTGCGLCVRHCAYGALSVSGETGKAQVFPVLCEDCGLCARLCPHQAISFHPVAESFISTSRFRYGILVHGDLVPGDDNSGKMITRLREIADGQSAVAGTDLQILDGPPGIGCPVLATLTGVDQVLIVSEPSLSGMSDLQRAFQVARSYTPHISVILNKADIHPGNASQIREWCDAQRLPLLAELPFDPLLVQAQIHCRSIVEEAPGSACSRQLRQAATHLFSCR